MVTGAASGIGLAITRRLAAEGMNLVMADIEAGPLAEEAAKVRADGAAVLDVVTDVSRSEALEALADAAYDRFGATHIVCNNAGVGAGGPIQDLRANDWEWVFGVNLWGVIHGLAAFLPRMLAGGEEGHIVNTASVAGLISAPMMAPYNASKFAVVAISEALRGEMMLAGTQIGVSVLCPGWVRTRINESGRNRPDHEEAEAGISGEPGGVVDQLIASGIDPDRVADIVIDGLTHDRFYILTHPEMMGVVEARMQAIVEAGREIPR